jgi:hypothetical protein
MKPGPDRVQTVGPSPTTFWPSCNPEYVAASVERRHPNIVPTAPLRPANSLVGRPLGPFCFCKQGPRVRVPSSPQHPSAQLCGHVHDRSQGDFEHAGRCQPLYDTSMRRSRADPSPHRGRPARARRLMGPHRCPAYPCRRGAWPRPCPGDTAPGRPLARGHLMEPNQSFRRLLAGENRSPRTIETYTDAVRLLAVCYETTGLPVLARNLGREHIQEYIVGQLAHWKPSTANNRYRDHQALPSDARYHVPDVYPVRRAPSAASVPASRT